MIVSCPSHFGAILRYNEVSGKFLVDRKLGLQYDILVLVIGVRLIVSFAISWLLPGVV